MITCVELGSEPLDSLQAILSKDGMRRFRDAMDRGAERLNGRTLWAINSTAEGGGVAEMLSTLLPYCVDAGWDVRWAVIEGSEEFFELTKRLHNALHGATEADGFGADDHRVYCDIIEANAAELRGMVRAGDPVIAHDPQTAGVITPLADAGARVAWQCHIGTDTPNAATKDAWNFLMPFICDAQRHIFSRHSYLWEGLDERSLRLIPPAIDPLSPKNAPMETRERDSVLTAAGLLNGSVETTLGVRRCIDRIGGEMRLPSDARIVLEVSRWDRLKDPLGFVRMAERLVERDDVHVVYAGPQTNGVDDDPEGAKVLTAAEELWLSLAPELRDRVHLLSVPMEDVDENAVIVNALQRRADVIVQKSLEEGFGLTVSEAMWKSKPVVASRIGGIQDQIEHGKSGILIDDPYDVTAFATAAQDLIDDQQRSRKLGEAAHVRVRDHFLGHRMLTQYAELIDELI